MYVYAFIIHYYLVIKDKKISKYMQTYFFNVLSYVYSKEPILGLTQEWFREFSFSRLECGVHDRLHIYPLCGIFHFPLHSQ